MDELKRTYWNTNGEVIPAPVPLFRPTKAKPKPTEDDFIALDNRKARRENKAAYQRQVKKGRRAYVREEMAKQNPTTAHRFEKDETEAF